MFKRYADVWSGIKGQVEKINNVQVGEYEKDYMKIQFNSDDNLPLNKMLKFRILTIIIRSKIGYYKKRMVNTIQEFIWTAVCMKYKC